MSNDVYFSLAKALDAGAETSVNVYDFYEENKKQTVYMAIKLPNYEYWREFDVIDQQGIAMVHISLNLAGTFYQALKIFLSDYDIAMEIL